jgi:hypothetical protein
MDLQTFLDARHLQSDPDDGMLDFLGIIDHFDLGVYDAVLVFKERRQVPASYITVFIDGGSQNRAAIFLEPSWIVGSPSKKRDPEWRSTYNHSSSSFAVPAIR